MIARGAIWCRTALGHLAVVALAFASHDLAADESPRVLGGLGAVYQLHEGAYGDLFPEDGGANPGNPVLALDVTNPDGVTERWLVPSTESADPDGSSTLVYEQNVGVYILWESWFNDLHPLLKLISFDGAEWSEAIEITNGPFAIKGSPELVITREKGLTADSVDLTTLHITWWEESGGASLKHYAPVFIHGGTYSGWSPVIDLSSYLPEGDPSVALPEVPGLENAVCLSPGKDERTVVAGFLNPRTNRLSTLEIEGIPQALRSIADKARAFIIINGVTASTSTELAEAMAEEMIAFGSQFHEATLAYMAGAVSEIIASADDLSQETIISVADKARAFIVIVGAEFGPDGLANPDESQILEVGQSADGDGPYQYLKVTVASDRVAPEVDGTAELILSKSGRGVIVKWETETHVYYRQSLDEGWTEVRTIELTESLDRDQVHRLLEDFVRSE